MITEFISSFITKQTGVISRAIAALLLSGLAWLATNFLGADIPEDQKILITSTAAGVIAWIITELSNRFLKKQATEVQKVINTVETSQVPTLKEDGVIQDKTIDALKKVASLINKKQ